MVNTIDSITPEIGLGLGLGFRSLNGNTSVNPIELDPYEILI